MGLRVRKQLVAASLADDVTYGTGNRRVGITIHETANTSRGAGAAAHANLQSRGNSRDASWHWTVDDTEAVQSFSHVRECWHAGDGRNGGAQTVAIEIAVNSDGDFDKAVHNAALLVRHIRATDPAVGDELVQHNHWSGKDCPNYLRDGSQGLGWGYFLALVNSVPRPIEHPTKPKPGKPSFDGRALQRAVEAHDDNVNGPDTRRRINAVRQASRWGGNDFPYGVDYTQKLVDTPADGDWGRNSAAAHDRKVDEIQRIVGAHRDGVWGPETDRKVKAYLAKMRTTV